MSGRARWPDACNAAAMALLVMFAPVLALAVCAGLVFAAEIERAKSKRARFGTLPPALRRRTIPGVIDPRL